MRAILLSEFWMALVYVAFIVHPNVYVLAVCASLHAFWFPNTDSAIQAYSYTLIPDRLVGRVMAVANTLRAASAPLGPLLAGLLLAHTSPQVAIAVLAAPVVVAAILGTLSPRFATCLASKLLPQQPVDDLRVGLALRLLHHLADEEAEHALLAAAVGLDLLRVRGDHGVDHRARARTRR